MRIDQSQLEQYQRESPETQRAIAEVEALSPQAWSWVHWHLNNLHTTMPDGLQADGPCRDCGTCDNISRRVDSDVWNAAVPPETGSPILCPRCFVVRAYQQAGIRGAWKLTPPIIKERANG